MFFTHRNSRVCLVVHGEHLPLLVLPEPPEWLLLQVGEVHVVKHLLELFVQLHLGHPGDVHRKWILEVLRLASRRLSRNEPCPRHELLEKCKMNVSVVNFQTIMRTFLV